MQLRELTEVTHMPIASIKFYLREGLLFPGKRLSAKRADYDERHIRRIRTIQTLRYVNNLSVAHIRAIVALIDQGASRIEILMWLQRQIQGVDDVGASHTGAGDAVVRRRGWPDVPTAARRALDEQLGEMERLGVLPSPKVLDVYSRAVDLIAHVDVDDAAAAEDLDTLVTRVAVGMHMHRQLVLRLLALAQTSRSIVRFGGAAPQGMSSETPERLPRSGRA